MKQTMNICILNVYNRYELQIKEYKSCIFEVRDIIFFVLIETQEKTMILIT